MAIPDLQFYLDKECKKPFNFSVDLGEYDVASGTQLTVYVKNPNKFAKAVFSSDVTKRDDRTTIKLPEQVKPGAVEPIQIILKAMVFTADVNEQAYFSDIDDLVTIPFKWVKA